MDAMGAAMTHDELLAKIDNNYFPGLTHMEQVEEMVKQDVQIKSALRAVVELHKPWTSVEGDNYFWGFRIEYGKQVCPICGLPSYPCPTIKAIEKELK